MNWYDELRETLAVSWPCSICGLPQNLHSDELPNWVRPHVYEPSSQPHSAVVMKTERKEVKCPFCTQMVGTHPSGGGTMVPHTTGRNRGDECFGSRRKP